MTLTVNATIEAGRLKVDVPTSLPAGDIQVEIVVPDNLTPRKHRDLSGIVGKLSYKGDPMALQKEMRDDWPD